MLLRIDQFAISLFVPPHVADVAVHHVRAGVDVADDALTRRNSVARRKLMVDWMTAFLFGNSRIGGKAIAPIAELCVGA